jgi:subtilisin family serine protease
MRLKVLALSLAVVVSACSEDPVQPTVPNPTASAAVQTASGGRSVVEFTGQLRSDFASQVAALGGTVNFVAAGAGFAGVSGLSATAAATLARLPGISAVYDDFTIQVDAVRRGDALAADVSAASPTNPAGAVLFPLQWNMLAINAPAAWAAGNLGSPNVTAAILDSGIDYDNFDMNGLVDLARSTSFVPSDDAILGALFPGRNTVDDLGGHGTLVASQVSSNALAFAGVSSRTRLMGIKVLGFTGSGSLGGILAGIIWAADHGADVANMSIDVPGGVDKAGNGLFVGIVNRTLNYAQRKGMVVVVAAGNDAIDMDGDGRDYTVFCEAPHVICVSATGPTSGTPFQGPWGNVDAPAPYTNIGRQSITVAAPGGTDFGFVSALCARHFIQVVNNAPTFPCISGTFILGGEGTSASAPHVTGVVAQMIAKYGKGRPSQIKQMLINGVDDLGAPGRDPYYGYGRVNVLKALSQ